MKRIARISCTLALLLMTLGAVPAAEAALQKAGAVSLVHGFPVWFQDANGLALQLCLDQNNAFCLLTPEFDPALAPAPGPLPITTQPGAVLSATNFPAEAFWYSASVDNFLSVNGGLDKNGLAQQGNQARFVLGIFLEAAFNSPDGNAANNQQVAFTRINLQGVAFGFVPNSTYTVTHPYGSFTFTTDAAGGTEGFRNEAGCFGPPCGAFDAVLPALLSGFPQQPAAVTVDRFLVWDPAVLPAAPAGFVGDPNVAHEVVFFGDPAPAARQSVVVSGPGLVATTIDKLFISGKKVGLDVTPFPATPVTRGVVGAAATAIPVTITNLTGVPLPLGPTPVAIAGADAADYTIAADPANTCANKQLAAAGLDSTCSFTVAFAPAAAPKGPRAAAATITPADVALAPAVSIALSGIAQFPVNLTISANGAMDKVVATGNVAAATENIDAGSSVTFLTKPNSVVANVSKFLPVVTVNGSAVKPAADGTFTLANLGAPQTVNVSFVRPGDVFVDQSGASDGQVTISDTLEALKIVTGLKTPTDAQQVASDVGPLVGGKPTADGLVDISDVLTILWRVVSPTNPNW